jgi:hypothetical protein
MPIIPKDDTFANKGFDEALAMARAGSEPAIHHLRRYIARDPDSKQSRLAASVLGE